MYLKRHRSWDRVQLVDGSYIRLIGAELFLWNLLPIESMEEEAI
ncbi:hypothetical protein [Thermococcus aciditolerans]|nr:hypothetical protein [Thermococcus aciditolerans]